MMYNMGRYTVAPMGVSNKKKICIFARRNACVLDARCGERTHTRTDDTLWGKCIVGKICAS